MSRHKRTRLFVDRNVQGALILRAVSYWAFCLLTIGLMLLCWRITTGPSQLFFAHFSQLWFENAPALIASIIVLPMIASDMVRFSNRFVGPLYRARRAMQSLADGEAVGDIHFRDGDFWNEFASAFNRVNQRVKLLEADLQSARVTDRTPEDSSTDTALIA